MFNNFAARTSKLAGSSYSFLLAIVSIVAWAISGPIFNYSDTWQLVINTSTTIITFLMIFLLQNSQNRDLTAIHAKLDKLIECAPSPNDLIRAENLPVEVIEELRP